MGEPARVGTGDRDAQREVRSLLQRRAEHRRPPCGGRQTNRAVPGSVGKPLVAKTDFQRMQGIDPMTFVDEDGAAYLYWGQGRCKAVKLNDDMISFNLADVRDLTPPWLQRGTVRPQTQGQVLPYLVRVRHPRPALLGGLCGGDRPDRSRAAANPILRQSGAVKGAGHHSIVQLPGRDEWVIAYHRFRIPDGNGYNRETRLSPLRHAADGSILPVGMSLNRPV